MLGRFLLLCVVLILRSQGFSIATSLEIRLPSPPPILRRRKSSRTGKGLAGKSNGDGQIPFAQKLRKSRLLHLAPQIFPSPPDAILPIIRPLREICTAQRNPADI